jgi:transcriptional antiterminator RfaH
MPSSWYVIQSKPRQEHKAYQELSNQGYEAFLPMMPVERIVQGQRVNKEEVLFSRYLFVRLSKQVDNWGPLRSTKGVSRLIRFGAFTPCLSHDELSHLKNWVHDLPKKEYFQAGQMLDVITGPFKGMQVTFERLIQAASGEERALVLFDLLGQVQHLGMNMADLKVLN